MSQAASTDRNDRRRDCLGTAVTFSGTQGLRMVMPAAAAELIAEHYSFSYREVLDAFNSVPASRAHWFDSPRGWTQLGMCVAAELGCSDVPPLAPTVH